MKKRQFLKNAGLVSVSMLLAPSLVIGSKSSDEVAAAAKSTAPVVPPNILWLIAEDIGLDLGCYGETVARTPNIDRLAKEGLLCRHAYSTAPVCSPSRSALITGMYQIAIGAQHHRSHRTDTLRLPSGVETVMERLRRAGYFTANIIEFPKGVSLNGAGKTDWNFQVDGKPFDSNRWSELKGHQPFFAQVNFHETHRVYKAADKNPTNPAKVNLPPYLPDNIVAREDWAKYLDCVATLDQKTGVVLDLLEKEGLRENTIVFWFGDNGRDDFRGKFYAFEQGCVVPLIVRWPGQVTAGSVSNDLLSLIDVTATSLYAAGIPVPKQMHGRPFLGPQAKPREYLFTARDRIDETLDRVRTVRDKRFKYIRNYQPERPYYQTFRYIEFEEYNPLNKLMKQLHEAGRLNADQDRMFAGHRPPEELYDLNTDPFEFHNLADVPGQHTTLERLRGVLDRWISETGDKGAIPEDPGLRAEELRGYEQAVKNLEKKWKH